MKLKFSKDLAELSDFRLVPVSTNPQESLKSAVQSLDTRNVNISVNGSSAIIRYVNFPKMTRDELKKSLKFEAQKHIPFSVGDVNLDAVILKPDLPDNKMLVSVAAVKKDFLAARLKLAKGADLTVDIVDVDSLALVNAFNFSISAAESNKLKSIALLNIGASYSNLSILENSVPMLARDINIAGNNFTQKIADSLGVDFKAAEAIKMNPDKERITKITQSADSVLSNLATEIRVSFDYYESERASSVTKIFLSGGGGQFLGLKDALASLLGIEVENWDPLGKIATAPGADSAKLKALSSQLAVATGLALRL